MALRFRFFCFAALVAWHTLITPVWADTKTFVIGVEDVKNFLPYSEYSENAYHGLNRDILDAFAKQKGYTFNYQIVPIKRKFALFVDSKLDFIFPDNPNWMSEQKKSITVHYAPTLEFTTGVLVRNQFMGAGVSHLKVLGVPLGFVPYPFQQLMSAGAMRIEESTEYDSLYQKLILGRVDGAYMDVRVAKYYWSKIKKSNDPPIEYDPDLPHASDYFCLSSINHPEIIKEFQQFLDANKALIDSLKAKYEFASISAK